MTQEKEEPQVIVTYDHTGKRIEKLSCFDRVHGSLSVLDAMKKTLRVQAKADPYFNRHLQEVKQELKEDETGLDESPIKGHSFAKKFSFKTYHTTQNYHLIGDRDKIRDDTSLSMLPNREPHEQAKHF